LIAIIRNQTKEMSEIPYLHRINLLLKIFATLASERVTAMGSPSGMKATIFLKTGLSKGKSMGEGI
jgi:hypothetical protein